MGVYGMIRLPGLIDIHAHLREPGATHKEDFSTGTAAALSGGFTTVLAMPNTQPPITTPEAFEKAIHTAAQKALCDWGQYLGAGPENAVLISPLAAQAAGLKMYLDVTYGDLRLDQMDLLFPHFENWPKESPIVAHAENQSAALAILVASLFDRSVHIAHVSRKEEVILIREAKEKGLKVTCEVCPHHLFLNEADHPRIGEGRSEVRPVLNTADDQAALWENLDVIDCFATDHAPHTLSEKDSKTPPPGFPGLESALPLLLTAVHQERLSIEDIILRFHDNPKQIFDLEEQPDTYIEIDPDIEWQFRAANTLTRCGWSPFEGWQMKGKVQKVVLRGREAYANGQILVNPGYGVNIRKP